MKKASLNRNFMLRLRMVNPIINCFKITSVMSSLSHKLVHVPCILSTVYLRKPSSHPRKAELIWMEWLSIFIFFKHSTTQSEQYNDCHEITWVTTQMMELNFETCWLKLLMVLVKTMKLWKNVSEHFLKRVSTLPGFSVREGFRMGMLVSEAISRIRTFLL